MFLDCLADLVFQCESLDVARGLVGTDHIDQVLHLIQQTQHPLDVPKVFVEFDLQSAVHGLVR